MKRLLLSTATLFFFSAGFAQVHCDCIPKISQECWIPCWTTLISSASNDDLRALGLDAVTANKITLYKWQHTPTGEKSSVSFHELETILNKDEYRSLNRIINSISTERYMMVRRHIFTPTME